MMSKRDVSPSQPPRLTRTIPQRLLLGSAALLLVLPPAGVLMWHLLSPSKIQQTQPRVQVQVAPAPPPAISAAPAPAYTPYKGPPRYANFGRLKVSSDARELANWVMYTADHQEKSFVIV